MCGEIDRNSLKLRELRIKDVPYMLEWMHNENVVGYLESNFLDKTSEECKKFILDAEKEYKKNKPFYIHYAIASIQDDEYLGTVSLKNICFQKSAAEFAIAVRRKAMGTGAANFAIHSMIERGFSCYHLKYIYWYVAPENKRAVRFYQKNGYQQVEKKDLEQIIGRRILNDKNYIWYIRMGLD